MTKERLVEKYKRGEAKGKDMGDLIKVVEHSDFYGNLDPITEFMPFIKWLEENGEKYKERWPEQHEEFKHQMEDFDVNRIKPYRR
jgi:hypothetical protein